MHAFACQRALAVVVLPRGIREKVLAQSILTTAGAHASPSSETHGSKSEGMV